MVSETDMRTKAVPDTAFATVPAHAPADHPEIAQGRTGVLMIALGTPDAPTYWATRRYLAEFLSDPRVIEVPRLLWLPILHGPILTFRSARSARAYASIWNEDPYESPLRTITRAQAEKMQDRMGDTVHVAWAFRYGQPSIETGLQALREIGCDRILLFALYPHYSATTSASSYDKAFEVLGRMRWQPAVRTMPPYHDADFFIEALASSVRATTAGLDWQPERIIASYHSIPQAYWDKGDPYPCQCKKTSRLLQQALGLEDGVLMTTYQSRVGPTKWVGPYTDESVEALAADGIKRILLLAPAFSADCLETLEELSIELREDFLAAGGTHFAYAPCLNDTDPGMDVLERLVRRELSGWVPSGS